MATLSTALPTLVDLAKTWDPDGKPARIVELLDQSNPILKDLGWQEGNLATGHRTTVRTGLPTVAWRLLNQGIQPTKSTTAQVDEATGILEAWSEIDKDVAELGGNAAAYRAQEAVAKIEAMNQEMAQTIFYGNQGLAPEEFNGLSIRYSDTTAANAQNMISGGAASGQTDCSSIWLCTWSGLTGFGIYPKGSVGGLVHDDLGLDTIETTGGTAGNAPGTRMLGYRERFQWKCGLAVKDWRYFVRIHSIDISANNADYIELMIRAIHKIPNLMLGKSVFYMNRTISQRLDILRRNDVQTGGQLSYDVVDGILRMSFRGIPIRVCDGLLESEDSLN